MVKPGRVMFELSGVPEPLAREAMRLAGHKLPVKTKFVLREGAPPNYRPHQAGTLPVCESVKSGRSDHPEPVRVGFE